jgi:carboxyl-terminal processing protease
MVWVERMRRRVSTAIIFVLLATLLVGGTGLAAGQAFSHAGQLTASADPDQVAVSALEPSGPAQVLRQAYDVLLDNFVTAPPPILLVNRASDAVVRRVAEVVPGEWPGPSVPAGADRDAAWAAFDAWFDRVLAQAGPAVDADVLREAALRGMAAAVEEHHTRYLSPKQYEEHQAWRRDDVRYGGIGARLRGQSPVVLEVFTDTPAERAGLRIGDQILEVDGKSTSGVPTDGVIGRIRGPLGSTVELLVSRHGVDQPFRVQVERAEIKLAFVKWTPLQRPDGHQYGYIQIRGFPDPGVDEKVGQALAELDQAGIDGLVLDLRGNTGGRIDVGLKVVSRFIKDDVVYQQLDRTGRERVVRTIGGYWTHAVPVTVLVDGGTASMGEIVASALQEAGAARIVGTKTSGNVAGARLFPLANGGALQVTVLEITSGRGALLNDIGVVPDEAIEMQDDRLLDGIDVQLEAGLRYLEAATRAPRAALLPAWQVLPEAA